MIAVFPGSFNPFHEGHLAIVKKMLPFVDKLYVVVMVDPKKLTKSDFYEVSILNAFQAIGKDNQPVNRGSDKIEVALYQGLLSDFCLKVNADVIINGLRNTEDFVKQQQQYYWNQDLGNKIPVFNLFSERSYMHYSGDHIRKVSKALKAKA